MNKEKRKIVIPLFIPHKGCPFDCIYCNQKTISGSIGDLSEEEAIKTIEACISTTPGNNNREIAFYGGSFTGIPIAEQKMYLDIANRYIESGNVKSIRLSTRPDYIDREILDFLKEKNVKTIELGVQSLDENVLKLSCRGHSMDDVITSSRLIKEYGFLLGIQTMIGLPGSGPEKELQTALKVIALKPDLVRIYPTLVIKGTYLAKLYEESLYTPLSLEDAVLISSKLLKLYKQNNINVIRIGLQPTESINSEADVIAGPFHPAFRQLVESRLALTEIEDIIERENLKRFPEIEILSSRRNVSAVVGQKRCNIEHLKQKYGFKNIRIVQFGSGSDEIEVKGIN